MKFTSAVVCLALAGGASAFAPAIPSAFVASGVVVSRTTTARTTGASTHAVGCPCAACSRSATHPTGCSCATCSSTKLRMSDAPAEVTADAVPEEVASLEGVQTDEEAHNLERPARKSLKKKGPKGKPLSEFAVGDVVNARVKTLTSYGAFLDIGAVTDGLLHISQLSVGFVSDVKEVLKEGDEMEVRITKIDEKKGQVGLTLLSAAQEQEAKEASQKPRSDRPQQQRNRDGGSGGGGGQARRDDSAVIQALAKAGWDSQKMVEGTVVSTVDFGAFVRIDVSQLNPEVTGEMDGLVHISALAVGRVDSVQSVVKVDDKVQVRVKALDGSKVSLTMVSAEAEQAAREASPSSKGSFSSDPADLGAKDWKESLEKVRASMPKFTNKPEVVSLRK